MKLTQMQYIKRNNKTNNYFDEHFIDSYAYIKQSNKDMDIHHIFKIIGLKESSPIIYNVDKHYYFTVPFNEQCKGFCYAGNNYIELGWNDKLYIMSVSEYIDTFRAFIKNDGKSKNEIPSKLIQDKEIS